VTTSFSTTINEKIMVEQCKGKTQNTMNKHINLKGKGSFFAQD
jgi:hypothetical protein